jgi:hypothetical protein
MSIAPGLHRDEITDRLADLIADLGDTADAIAYRLAEAGITGQPTDATCCPIANYLRKVEPSIDYVAVLGDAVDVLTTADDDVHLTVSDAVNDFVSRFDLTQYPHLIARTEVTR